MPQLIDEIERLKVKYGEPRLTAMRIWMGVPEYETMKGTMGEHSQDVTLFIIHEGRIAVMHKHYYPEGVYRAPSGRVRPGETIEACALREGFEETGLRVKLERYLLRSVVTFFSNGEETEWVSDVFVAGRMEGDLKPSDTEEVKDVKWVSPKEVETTFRGRMMSSGSGGLKYRAYLTDVVLKELQRLGYL